MISEIRQCKKKRRWDDYCTQHKKPRTRTRDTREKERQKMGFRIRIKSNYAIDLGKLHFDWGRYNIARTGNKRTERQRETGGRDERGVKRGNESENEQERHGMG